MVSAAAWNRSIARGLEEVVGPLKGTREDVVTVSVDRAAPVEPDGAFAAFYEREYPTLLRLAYLLTRSTSVAEDVVQESFLAVHERFPSLDCPGAYLRVTVVNRCRRWHRAGAREERRNRLFSAGEEAVPAEASELFDVLGRLPARQQTVVVLRYWMGLSEREIAEAIGCRPGTVKSLASRALAQLREELERRTPRSRSG